MSSNQPYPPQIAGNPVLKMIWKQIHFKDSNFILLVVGLPGAGKSLFALQLAWMLDRDYLNRPRFTTKNIVFSAKDFVQRIDELADKRGSVCIWEEPYSAIGGTNSRRAMSDANNKISTIFQSMRHIGHCIILTLPAKAAFDKQSRDVSHATAMLLGNNGNASVARFYIHQLNGLNGRCYTKNMIFKSEGQRFVVRRIITPMPPANLVRAYKAKANYWKSTWRKSILKTIDQPVEKKKSESGRAIEAIRSNPDHYKTPTGEWNTGKIADNFDVSTETARRWLKKAYPDSSVR